MMSFFRSDLVWDPSNVFISLRKNCFCLKKLRRKCSRWETYLSKEVEHFQKSSMIEWFALKTSEFDDQDSEKKIWGNSIIDDLQLGGCR